MVRECWETVSGNVARFSDFAGWIAVVEEPLTPVIEDPDFCNRAAGTLPDGDLSEETWPVWTGALREETGRKGKQLFMPLRLALTGLDHGPEMKKLLPLVGSERAKARLRGETA